MSRAPVRDNSEQMWGLNYELNRRVGRIVPSRHCVMAATQLRPITASVHILTCNKQVRVDGPPLCRATESGSKG